MSAETPNVLIVGPDRHLRTLAAEWQERGDARVVVCDSASEAEVVLYDIRFIGTHLNAVLVDYKLSDKAGCRFVAEQRDNFPEASFALISNFNSTALNMWARAFQVLLLTKPLLVEDIHRVLLPPPRLAAPSVKIGTAARTAGAELIAMERLHDPYFNDRLRAASTSDGWEIWLPDHETSWYELLRQVDNTPVQLLNDSARAGRVSIVSPCVATNWRFDCQIEGLPRFQSLCYAKLGRSVFEAAGICIPNFEEWETYLNRESRLCPFAVDQMRGAV